MTVLPDLHPRRAEYVVGSAGTRSFRVLIYGDRDAECDCQDGKRGDCPHIRHARRLMTEPARVALEEVVRLYAATPLQERTDLCHALYRTALHAIQEDDRRIADALRVLDHHLDTRTLQEREAEAVRLFDNTGQHGKGYSAEDRRRLAALDEADRLRDLRTAGPDTTIIRSHP